MSTFEKNSNLDSVNRQDHENIIKFLKTYQEIINRIKKNTNGDDLDKLNQYKLKILDQIQNLAISSEKRESITTDETNYILQLIDDVTTKDIQINSADLEKNLKFYTSKDTSIDIDTGKDNEKIINDINKKIKSYSEILKILKEEKQNEITYKDIPSKFSPEEEEKIFSIRRKLKSTTFSKIDDLLGKLDTNENSISLEQAEEFKKKLTDIKEEILKINFKTEENKNNSSFNDNDIDILEEDTDTLKEESNISSKDNKLSPEQILNIFSDNEQQKDIIGKKIRTEELENKEIINENFKKEVEKQIVKFRAVQGSIQLANINSLNIKEEQENTIGYNNLLKTSKEAQKTIEIINELITDLKETSAEDWIEEKIKVLNTIKENISKALLKVNNNNNIDTLKKDTIDKKNKTDNVIDTIENKKTAKEINEYNLETLKIIEKEKKENIKKYREKIITKNRFELKNKKLNAIINNIKKSATKLKDKVVEDHNKKETTEEEFKLRKEEFKRIINKITEINKIDEFKNKQQDKNSPSIKQQLKEYDKKKFIKRSDIATHKWLKNGDNEEVTLESPDLWYKENVAIKEHLATLKSKLQKIDTDIDKLKNEKGFFTTIKNTFKIKSLKNYKKILIEKNKNELMNSVYEKTKNFLYEPDEIKYILNRYDEILNGEDDSYVVNNEEWKKKMKKNNS